MAKLVFGLNQSPDGYIDHQEFTPGPALFHHFIEQVRGLTGSVYGRRMYEVMRVWDEEPAHPRRCEPGTWSRGRSADRFRRDNRTPKGY
jgi:hypothetical protein